MRHHRVRNCPATRLSLEVSVQTHANHASTAARTKCSGCERFLRHGQESSRESSSIIQFQGFLQRNISGDNKEIYMPFDRRLIWFCHLQRVQARLSDREYFHCPYIVCSWAKLLPLLCVCCSLCSSQSCPLHDLHIQAFAAKM